MVRETIIARARRASGLSQRELARRSGTSQSTLSNYENGEKSPTLPVVERLINTSGFELDLAPRIVFSTHAGGREEPYVVPNRLWRLDLVDALARVVLPSHLYWSGPPLEYDLSNRRDRARVYEIVLREGVPNDLMKYIDGAFLIDLWDDLVLPRVLRAAWEPLIRHCRGEGVYAGRPSS